MCLGIPGQIVEIVDVHQKLALIDVGGVKRQVSLALIVDEAHPVESCLGEWALIHVGFAMNRIDVTEAEETLSLLAELTAAQDQVRVENQNEYRSSTV